MGGKHTSDWHPEARAMRLAGSTIRQISERFQRSSSAVSDAIKGIKCPIDHKKSYDISRRATWVDEARALRRTNMSYTEIAKRVNADKSTVIKYCKDIGAKAPPRRVYTPESIAQGIATAKANRERAIRDGLIVPAIPKPRSAYKKNARPVVSREEKRRRMMRRLVKDGTQQRRVEITLPTIKSLSQGGDL